MPKIPREQQKVVLGFIVANIVDITGEIAPSEWKIPWILAKKMQWLPAFAVLGYFMSYLGPWKTQPLWLQLWGACVLLLWLWLIMYTLRETQKARRLADDLLSTPHEE